MVERTLPKPDTRVRFPSAALHPLTSSVRGFCFGLLWVWLVEAVCSLLLQGTRPRSASDTLMSRRNIPASPILIPSPSLWYEVGCGLRGGECTAGSRLGKSVRGGGEGNTGVRYRRQLAKNKRWVEGAYQQAWAERSYRGARAAFGAAVNRPSKGMGSHR